MPPALFDQLHGHGIAGGVVFRGPHPHAFGFQHAPGVVVDSLPQALRKIDRRCDSDKRRNFFGARLCGEQADPGAHRRADDHLRAVRNAVEHRQRVVEPIADGAVDEFAGGLAVALIVESGVLLALRPARRLESLRLRTRHVGFEAWAKDHAGTVAGCVAIGDCDAAIALQYCRLRRQAISPCSGVR